MSITIVYTMIALSAIGILAAVILYFVAQKFKVYEDPRIDEVESALPGANCGGCGFAGCRAFAEACVKENELSALFCPVGGNDCMTDVAGILGLEAVTKDPRVAVVRCNGTCEHRPKTNQFDGASSCAVASSLYSGDTGCQYGCLGHGDCVAACDFDAIHMNPETGLPEVIDDKCVACGACVEACPKTLIELRKRGPKDRKIYVSCRNEDKGGIAKKSCEVACIGCSKCFKVCPFDAITMKNNLAFIDSDKCKLCRKCVVECPTNAIIELGFPPRKIKADLPPKPAVKKEAPVKKEVKATEENKTDNIEKK
ncbi:Fe-S cluster domain-containing protein [Sunxiuqinia elliptica]|uniref:Ion-translocating oxidoreductase complex subunit B n=1 Tax=Sunxiuqinia elliptica TaxID=655355 RepID=A0A1I2H6B5_9BACT|nr:Fe-S cluster domain-containing protein [Sunxiuqinia elliptica]TDN99862.1 RnfABCDGE-type electron transport complex B subunit [Sunxiuqinia elliptica]TDO57054.1 RnfABCDGE-type electron transport complex B subunit [Sunxiuqinia elliptica]SFF24316.1 electron transport complex, RnfABCDGE type, B subunit [Sunxiuqinia elliptica]